MRTRSTRRARRTPPDARAAMEAKFRAEVDPEGKLSPAELEKRVRHAKSVYYARMSAKRWKQG